MAADWKRPVARDSSPLGAERSSLSWDRIFRKEGRYFLEPFPEFEWLLGLYRTRGVRRILDVGSGSGRHTVALSRAGFSVTGMDIAPEGLRLSRAWLADEGVEAHLLRADFRQPFPLRSNYFDGLISAQTIHHALLSGVVNAIAEIHRVMAPGGLAFIGVAGRTHPDENYAEIEPGTFLPLDGDEAGLPHHIFTLDELAEAFGRFRILDIGPRAEGRVLVVLAEKPAVFP